MLLDRTQDAEHQGKGSGRAEAAIVRLAAAELSGEIADDRPVEVLTGIVERRGHVLQFIQAK
jgi:hypothetical protein